MPEAKAKATSPQYTSVYEGRGVKVPGVIAVGPETSRSSPGQDEVARKRDGGPLPVLICKSFG
jgi:hypothetical protein